MLKHHYVGICGYPNTGKTTLANLLQEHSDLIVAMDDGRPLRNGVKGIFGCSEEDVNTQEGKTREYKLPRQVATVRGLLGWLGDDLEARYGDFIMPYLAIQWAEKNIEHPSVVILPSVRKNQGDYIQQQGGDVVMVTRYDTRPIYPFDNYDPEFCNHKIENNDSLEFLKLEAMHLGDILIRNLAEKYTAAAGDLDPVTWLETLRRPKLSASKYPSPVEAPDAPWDKRLGVLNVATPEGYCAEEAYCVNACLDDRGVPREEGGKTFSLWGRVCEYVKNQDKYPPKTAPSQPTSDPDTERVHIDHDKGDENDPDVNGVRIHRTEIIRPLYERP